MKKTIISFAKAIKEQRQRERGNKGKEVYVHDYLHNVFLRVLHRRSFYPRRADIPCHTRYSIPPPPPPREIEGVDFATKYKLSLSTYRD